LLFVPGNRDRMLQRGPTAGADALLPDLEDAVPMAEKPLARQMLREWIPQQSVPVYVRVNAVETGMTRDDIEGVAVKGLTGLFVPKVQHVDEVKQVAAWLDEIEPKAGFEKGSVELILMLETALGVYRGYDLATASPRVASLCFGSGENGDFQTDMGCDWTLEGPEIMYGRQKTVLEARAAGIMYPIDGVYVRLDDEEGLVRDTTLAKRLGYKGRCAIHPKQVEAMNRVFTPSQEEVDYYRRLLEAFDVAMAENKASVTFEGRMIDYAMAARARSVLALADAVGL
jgi:citrate lyase subunit beta/citryl-CoA lyase